MASSIGYLWLPPAIGDGAPAIQYAGTAHDVIRTVDHQAMCGWIVDLRDDGGGNMWPMLAGVGPILGEGDMGAFVDARGRRAAWSYYRGQALLNGTVWAAAPEPAYEVRHAMPPVAILTSRRTASAGEAVVVAFRGRPQTRSFGEATFGAPTANMSHSLSDGARLFVTVAFEADRNGQVYDAPIPPDEDVASGEAGTPPAEDPVLRRAGTWLQTVTRANGWPVS